ncbi:TatD family hydrolase [Shimazuella kribbensis]|uniref:TatD family hydrolase n=1 Tax=Shimazuella kribbensis TaxID=139808 RepID=UPI0004172D67|nr:TatD family hydrolase [Shimazuella kribbensis]
MLFETHTHLNAEQFDEDREEVIKRTTDAGVSYILNIGYNRETIPSSIQLAETYPFFYTSVGWHPQDAISCTEEDLVWLRTLASHAKVVAIGEIGLDYYWDTSPKGIQHDIFRKQIRLAKEVNLPIIIHNRDADEDVIRILKEENAEEIGGVMHCFSGDIVLMEQCISLNFSIGIGGPVTFKNRPVLKEVAKVVPLDRLLLETDSPYLAPHPFRGKRNESSYVRLVAEEIARLREMPLEELAHITTQNAKKLFEIK